MSIYDEQFNEEPRRPRKPAPNGGPPFSEQFATPPPGPVSDQNPEPAADTKFAGEPGPNQEPPKRRGCGCRSCFLALLLMGLLGVAFCGIGGYLTYRNAPEWAHDAIVAAVNDSDLDAEAKQKIAADMDRLLKEYRAGNISSKQAGKALDELAESPLPMLIIVYAAMESYVEPSGFTEEEKTEAKRVFQRVARGSFEKSIDPDNLEKAFDYISKKDFNGNRQLKSKVSDADLRDFVEECKKVADEAEVPDEPYEVDVAGEVTRIVDRALGIAPDEEELAPDDSDPADSDPAESDPSADADASAADASVPDASNRPEPPAQTPAEKESP